MKGYKGLTIDKDGRFYCKPDLEKEYYEIGVKKTTTDVPILCRRGFHFCNSVKNVYRRYPSTELTAIAEVEAEGKIIVSEDNKVCSSITVIRILSLEEIMEELKDCKEPTVCESGLVTNSYAVMNSSFTATSRAVMCSNNIRSSDSVFDSNNVDTSFAVDDCNIIGNSNAVATSNLLKRCIGISDSVDLVEARGADYSTHSFKVKGISNSHAISKSEGVFNCLAITNCKGIANAIFTCDKTTPYTLFGKEVPYARFHKVKNNIMDLLEEDNFGILHEKDGFVSEYCVNTRELKEHNPWKNLSEKTLEYIKSLPEFDLEIFNRIISCTEEE